MASVTVHRYPVRLVAVVAVGGAVGACARYGVSELMPSSDFPWATFLVNVSGSFVLALLATRLRSEGANAFVGPGVLGGFTTLSAYSEETRHLLDTGHPLTALLYLLGTLAACLAAVSLARRVP